MPFCQGCTSWWAREKPNKRSSKEALKIRKLPFRTRFASSISKLSWQRTRSMSEVILKKMILKLWSKRWYFSSYRMLNNSFRLGLSNWQIAKTKKMKLRQRLENSSRACSIFWRLAISTLMQPTKVYATKVPLAIRCSRLHKMLIFSMSTSLSILLKRVQITCTKPTVISESSVWSIAFQSKR